MSRGSDLRRELSLIMTSEDVTMQANVNVYEDMSPGKAKIILKVVCLPK